nr:Islet cell autoantigen 1 [Hymenolepis microstoma]
MYYESSGNRYQEYIDDSTTHKLKSAYWSTRQAVIRKLGKEEDRHIVASDAELDAKLELFKSVQTTCQELSTCIDAYLRCIFVLSQVENDTGRFLNARSSEDKTRAGKMLSAVGKALSHSAQQRLVLQNPLSRLEQEVQTFRARAIGDTESTIKRMETARTEYRGALMWMKNVSEELDPDMYKKLDKFRRVQTQVKKNKANFDRLKLAVMQKVDLLAASRCNMLSHVLAAYQDTLLQFWERTACTMTTVANSFKGYQYYEFALLKDLTPESRKLAEQTSQIFDTEEEQLDDETNIAEESLIEAEREVTQSGNSANSESSVKPPEDLLPEEEYDKKLNDLFATTDIDRAGKTLDDMFFSTASTSDQDSKVDIFQDLEVTEGNTDGDFLKDIFSLEQPAPNFFDEPPRTPGGGVGDVTAIEWNGGRAGWLWLILRVSESVTHREAS